jgi:hypothetical protein
MFQEKAGQKPEGSKGMGQPSFKEGTHMLSQQFHLHLVGSNQVTWPYLL